MFDKVVVGVDDHQAGRDALELATRLVSPNRTLMLVHVQMLAFATPPDADPHRARDLAERGRALERLAALRDEAHVTPSCCASMHGLSPLACMRPFTDVVTCSRSAPRAVMTTTGHSSATTRGRS
jgi:nucleotide-binding universal stress UspA family protein